MDPWVFPVILNTPGTPEGTFKEAWFVVASYAFAKMILSLEHSLLQQTTTLL